MRNHTAFHRTLLAAGFVAALAAVPFAQAGAQDAYAGSDSSQANQTVPGKVDDAWITTKVKSEFATTKEIPATNISVDTSDGRVRLTGTVANDMQKNRAIEVAHRVKGVKSVDATGLTVTASGESP
ncbi:BON domain-containing protein [Fulvimonas yonginensis]|uniref:BON domain-containing protein n=1 Tax=Fulvimonas yonginensis TaxID=1495200 RepID=A0ABU8J9Z7_9GAMM